MLRVVNSVCCFVNRCAGLTLICLISITPAAIAQDFAGGSGTEADPYQVATAGQLNAVRDELDAHYVLSSDIDLSADYGSGAGWSPIGDGVDAFTGVFDGDGHEVAGLFIDRPTAFRVGLFGSINGGSVRDVFLRNVDVTGRSHVGALSGEMLNAALAASAVTGQVSGDGVYVGGAIGVSFGGSSIERVATDVKVTNRDGNAEEGTGGLVGSNRDSGSIISRSFSLGEVSGAENTGGLVGENYSGAQIVDSFARGSVQVLGSGAGGLVGRHYGSGADTTLVARSFSSGLTQGFPPVGGLIAVRNTADVNHSYWDTETSGTTSSDGGTGRTTAQMTDTSGYDASWDFDTVWARDDRVNDGYPYLPGVFESLLNDLRPDNDGDLSTAGGITGPVNLGTHMTSSASAVDVFDFTLTDGGGGDGEPLTVEKLAVHVSGTSTEAERSQVTWRLNGPDASQLEGSYDTGTQTLVFDDLAIAVADGTAETYTLNAYFADSSGVTVGNTFSFSMDGDADLVVAGSGTQMASATTVTSTHATTIYANGFDSGAGTEADPYPVANADHLGNIRNHLSAYYQLNSDVDLSADFGSGAGWAPIGSDANPFTGVFDGNGHQITGLYINRPAQDNIGLFGEIDGGSVSNLFLNEVDVTGNSRVGALTGELLGGLIKDVGATGRITGGGFHAGGLIGVSIDGSTVERSAADVQVTGPVHRAGGLIGYSYGVATVIRKSFALGDVAGAEAVGGLVGENYEAALIEDSFARGDVNATGTLAGGLTAENYSNGATIARSFAAGRVIGATNGGLVALILMAGEVEHSYWDTETSGTDSSDGGSGRTSAEMQDVASYDQSWDFDTVWDRQDYINGGYPYLRGVFESLLSDDTPDSDGDLTAAGGITGPVTLGTRVTSSASAVDVFDFMLTDGGADDGVALAVEQVTVHVSGTSTDAERSQVTWRLDGPDANQVEGSYEAGTQSLVFDGLDISVADGTSQTYTLNAYFSDSSGVTVGNTFNFSIDGDTDLVLTGSGTQMGTTTAVTSAHATTIDADGFVSGSGAEVDPYRVATADQLDNLRNYLDAHYVLTGDLDLAASYGAGEGWQPIGTSTDPFTGVLNGNGHEISGLYIDRSSGAGGLFGHGDAAQVHDLFLPDVDINAVERVGALAGRWRGGRISGVAATGHARGKYFVGGLTGMLEEAAVLEDSAADVTIDHDELLYGGGLVGHADNDGTVIRRSFALGNVSGANHIGGLLGYTLSGDILVSDSFSRGNAYSDSVSVGGLIGQFRAGQMRQSYATGSANTDTNFYGPGGCCNLGGEARFSYWDTETSGAVESFHGIGLTTNEMQYAGSYDASWDFTTVWDRDAEINGGYPYLRGVFEELLGVVALDRDGDGDLTLGGGVTEAVTLRTTMSSPASAVDVFDFSLSDGGGADGLSLEVWRISLHVSGTASDAEINNVTWRLNGPGVNQVEGSYDAGSQSIIFSALDIAVAEGTAEVYTVNAYFADSTGATNGNTFVLGVDGDRDVLTTMGGSQMGTTTAVASDAITVQVVAPPAPPGDANVIFGETRNGTLSGNATISASGVFNGGTINGNVDNRGLITGNIILGSNASVTGGRISGRLTGDANAPARIDDALVVGDARLENLLIGAGTTLGPDVVLGPNVRFESDDSIHSGLMLTESLESLIWEAGDARSVPLLDDSVLTGETQTVLDAIRELEYFALADTALVQDEASGELRLSGDDFSVAVLPLSVRKAFADELPGAYVDGNGDVRFVTDTGRVVLATPVLEDRDVFERSLANAGLSLAVYDARGNMMIDEAAEAGMQSAALSAADSGSDDVAAGQSALDAINGSGYDIGRADLLSVPASRADAPGLVTYAVPGMGTLIAYSVVFDADSGVLMQQDIVPVPADWPALRQAILALPGATDVNINERGMLAVELDGQTINGRMDYRVEFSPAEPGDTTLIDQGDLTGNGVTDFEVEYPDGRRQRLFVYP